MKIEWLETHVKYIDGLKAPSEKQRLLAVLYKKSDRDKEDEKKLIVLARSEAAAIRAAEANRKALKLLNADKAKAAKAAKEAAEEKRRKRDHEMYQVAGLMSLAGVVHKETGVPLMDRGELLGALMAMIRVPVGDQRRATWKREGDALLAEKGLKASHEST